MNFLSSKVHYYHLKRKLEKERKVYQLFKLFDCLSNFCCFINVDHLVEDVYTIWYIVVVSVYKSGILSFTKVFKMFSKVKRAKIDEDAMDALNQQPKCFKGLEISKTTNSH